MPTPSMWPANWSGTLSKIRKVQYDLRVLPFSPFEIVIEQSLEPKRKRTIEN
jgi:hypothetical protein